jgi:hypothetical protein
MMNDESELIELHRLSELGEICDLRPQAMRWLWDCKTAPERELWCALRLTEKAAKRQTIGSRKRGYRFERHRKARHDVYEELQAALKAQP